VVIGHSWQALSVSNSRLVYSTGVGRRCEKCGWPEDNCQCSGRHARDEAVPSRVIAKLRLEKKGRGGKSVTVIFDLPANAAFLKELAGDLKRACGTGGAVAGNTIEIQGDQRVRLRELLQGKGYIVKG
jgi:translation initiation factor 1